MPFKTQYYINTIKKRRLSFSSSAFNGIYEDDDINEILGFLAQSVSSYRYCLPDKDELIDWGAKRE